jgi:hypothetical protein
MTPTRLLPILIGMIALLARDASAQAGLTSNIATVAISATHGSQLSVTINSGATQTLATITDNTTNDFSSPVNITTSWDLVPSTASVSLMGYFAVPAQALLSGANAVPSSQIKGRMTTGSPVTYTAFTQNAVGGLGTAGGSLRLFNVSILGNNRTDSRTDNLDLQLDLTGFPTLASGTYSGTLTIRAVTQ